MGRKPKTKDPVLGNLLSRYASHLKKGTISTQQEVADRIFQETGQKISQPTISRFFKKKESYSQKG
ncbi:MAG: hypothetical protein NY202_01845 [Mollicutes bacterium UO1]